MGAALNVIGAHTIELNLNHRHMFIPSPYQAQCNLIREILVETLPDIYPHDYRDTSRILDETVSTKATSQRLENWLIIYKAGRGPRDHRPPGPKSIVKNLHDLYAVNSRSNQRLVFVGLHQYMQDNCR